MPDLKFKEPISSKKIYIDPITDDLQLLMPIVAGGAAGIGIDNTCKTVVELQKFFGFRQAEKAQPNTPPNRPEQ